MGLLVQGLANTCWKRLANTCCNGVKDGQRELPLRQLWALHLCCGGEFFLTDLPSHALLAAWTFSCFLVFFWVATRLLLEHR